MPAFAKARKIEYVVHDGSPVLVARNPMRSLPSLNRADMRRQGRFFGRGGGLGQTTHAREQSLFKRAMGEA